MRLVECPGVADSLVNLSFFFPGSTEERDPRFASVKRIIVGYPLLFSLSLDTPHGSFDLCNWLCDSDFTSPNLASYRPAEFHILITIDSFLNINFLEELPPFRALLVSDVGLEQAVDEEEETGRLCRFPPKFLAPQLLDTTLRPST